MAVYLRHISDWNTIMSSAKLIKLRAKQNIGKDPEVEGRA